MKNVIACIDGAAYTKSVCDHAIWAARRLQTPLEFLHVLTRDGDVHIDASGSIGLGAHAALLQELSDLDERRSAIAREHGSHLLDGARQVAAQAGLPDAGIRQRHGDLTEALVALEPDTRLYVMGQHDYEARPKRFLLDHNLERAVRALHRPILVASASFAEPRRFMIAFDGSETGRKMVEMVGDSPLLSGLECQIVTVGNAPEALVWAGERLRNAGFEVTSHQLEGDPANALANHARDQDIDMMVMGAYGHSRIRHLVVGSTTTAILRQSRIPVFVLR